MNNNRKLTTNVVLNGHSIPVLGWMTHYTSYGNLCTFEVHVPIKQIKQLGYDIFSDIDSNPQSDCKIILNDESGQFSGLVFDGIVDTVEGTWEDDILEITGRDFSAILRDTIDTLDKYVNQTVGQVVTGIASQYGLQTNIQAPSQIAGIRASTFQGENWSFSTNPQPTWHIIQQLAEEVDCVAYVDQHRVLNFVPPGASGQNHKFFWRPTNANGQITSNPILKLSILQQSRRCNNFTLFLHGTDVNGNQTLYKVDDVGTGGRIIHKTRQDLNSENIDSIWQSIANEIQRKNLVAKLVVEGDVDINLNDTVTIAESEDNDLLGLDNKQLFIVSLLHSFSMPDYGSSVGDGFLTHITCNQNNTGSA